MIDIKTPPRPVDGKEVKQVIYDECGFIPDDEMISCWLIDLYRETIENTKCNISNSRLWEKSYSGEEPNPYTQHIANLEAYIKKLDNLKTAEEAYLSSRPLPK